MCLVSLEMNTGMIRVCIPSWPLNDSMDTSDRWSNICLNVVIEQIGPMLGHLDCYVKNNTVEKFVSALLFKDFLPLRNLLRNCTNYSIEEGKKRQ